MLQRVAVLQFARCFEVGIYQLCNYDVDCNNGNIGSHDTWGSRRARKMLEPKNLPSAEVADVPEKIAGRKVIVYKSRVDPATIRLTAEKMKGKLFVKFGFSKPNPEEVLIGSIDEFYEKDQIEDSLIGGLFYSNLLQVGNEVVVILDKVNEVKTMLAEAEEAMPEDFIVAWGDEQESRGIQYRPLYVLQKEAHRRRTDRFYSA